MTLDMGTPRKILAVVDTGETQTALQSALALADTHGAALEAITCAEPPHDLSILSRISGEDTDHLIADAVAKTRDIVEARLAHGAPGRSVKLTVATGKTYLEIIRYVAASGCDFVIKKAERLSGMDRFLFASTDQHLLRKCPCPVWLQTDAGPKRPRRILAAVDLDLSDAEEPDTLNSLNRRVMEAAVAIAGGEDAEVVVLHAWDAIGEGMIWAFSSGRDARLSSEKYVNAIMDARHREMGQFLSQMREEIGPAPRLIPRLVRGAPEAVIKDEKSAIAADVVVMGTVARTGLSGVFIGNTAENIINTLDCPVIAVKPDGFVSPLLR